MPLPLVVDILLRTSTTWDCKAGATAKYAFRRWQNGVGVAGLGRSKILASVKGAGVTYSAEGPGPVYHYDSGGQRNANAGISNLAGGVMVA